MGQGGTDFAFTSPFGAGLRGGQHWTTTRGFVVRAAFPKASSVGPDRLFARAAGSLFLVSHSVGMTPAVWAGPGRVSWESRLGLDGWQYGQRPGRGRISETSEVREVLPWGKRVARLGVHRESGKGGNQPLHENQ